MTGFGEPWHEKKCALFSPNVITRDRIRDWTDVLSYTGGAFGAMKGVVETMVLLAIFGFSLGNFFHFGGLAPKAGWDEMDKRKCRLYLEELGLIKPDITKIIRISVGEQINQKKLEKEILKKRDSVNL